MKRKPSPAGPATCECCDADDPIGGFSTFEGFLVCGVCRREQAAKLSARRRKVDQKTLATLGEVIRAKRLKL